MLSRCKPALDTEDPPLGLSTVDICTTDIHSHIMIDGFKSFPSGHSSCKEEKEKGAKFFFLLIISQQSHLPV